MPHSTTSFEKSENDCGFLVRTLPAILVQNKWFQRVSQVICAGENTQCYPKRFTSRGERSIWVPPARLVREWLQGTAPHWLTAMTMLPWNKRQQSGRSDEPSRHHSNGPFSTTSEPFWIKLSVFLSTNHLRNTLESFVLQKNGRIYAN